MDLLKRIVSVLYFIDRLFVQGLGAHSRGTILKM